MRALVVAGIAALAGVGVLVGALAYQLNGGWPLPRTDPDDPRVEAAHARWAPAWEERHAGMVGDLEAAGLVVLSVNELDSCREGEASWKRRDPYGLRCSLTWQAVLGAPAGDPTGTVSAVHEVAQAHSDPDAGPDGLATLLSSLESFEEGDTQVAQVAYYGTLVVDGEGGTTRLEAFATRAPRDSFADAPDGSYGDVVRAAGGPPDHELARLHREWAEPAVPVGEARWLVRLTDRVDYFSR